MNPLSRPGVTQENLKAFIGNNSDKIIRRGSNDISWCWPAFFFSFLWLAYRKAYVAALVVLVVEFTLQALAIVYEVSEINAGDIHIHFHFSFLILRVLLALFGLRYYLHFAAKKIEKINAETADAALRQTWYQSKGGTSVSSMVGFAILSIAVSSSVWFSVGEPIIHHAIIESTTVQKVGSETTSMTIVNSGTVIKSTVTETDQAGS